MALPPRSYFHLRELARRWDASMSDIACYTIDGLLEVSIMTIGLVVETGTFEADGQGVFRLPEGERVLNGPQPVVASDLWPVFRHGSGQIGRFKPQSANGYIEVAGHLGRILITLEDLLVTAPERDRFEQAYGLGPGEAQSPASIQVTDSSGAAPRTGTQFVHRDDYSEVVFSGELFGTVRNLVREAGFIIDLRTARRT